MEFEWQVDISGYKLLSLKESDEVKRFHDDLSRARWFGAAPRVPVETTSAPPVAPGPNPRTWWVGSWRGFDDGRRYREMRRYSPLLESPALYRTFSETEPTRETIVKFANQYGLLGIEETADATEPLVNELGISSKWEIEPIGEWIAQILNMRWAIEIWDILLAKRHSELVDFIHLDMGRRVLVYDRTPPIMYFDIPEAPLVQSERIIASRDENHSALTRFEDDEDPVPAAHLFVQRSINHALRRRVGVEIGWNDQHVLKLQTKPSSLLAAMWCQFAEHVGKGTLFRRCRNCGAWLGVGSKGTRPDKKHCSDSCRVLALGKRRTEAQELAIGGVSVADIAEKLGSNPETIRRWIAASRQQSAAPKLKRQRRGP